MKFIKIIISILFVCSLAISALATEEHGEHDIKKSEATAASGFIHHVETDNIRSEFQIMRLANMNQKSEDGTTHHIMVKLFRDGMDYPIDGAVGKIKIVGPDKKEQISSLKNFNGILAANFTFEKHGKYGIICLFKVDGKKKVVKFWYPHKG
jgi:hypothetical protein